MMKKNWGKRHNQRGYYALSTFSTPPPTPREDTADSVLCAFYFLWLPSNSSAECLQFFFIKKKVGVPFFVFGFLFVSPFPSIPSPHIRW